MAVNLTRDALLSRLTSAFKQKDDLAPGDGLYDLADVLATALYAEFSTALVDYRVQLTRNTQTGAFLDMWLNFHNIPRLVGETDAQARLRLARKRIELWGGISLDEMLQLIATSLEMDPADIQFTENLDENGLYEPARINFTVPQEFFPDGSDIAEVTADLEMSLNRAAAGGVKVTFSVDVEGAVYDDPAYVYDSPTTLYG